MASEIFHIQNKAGNRVCVSVNKTLFYLLAVDQGGYEEARNFIRSRLAGEDVVNSERVLYVLALQIAKLEIVEKIKRNGRGPGV